MLDLVVDWIESYFLVSRLGAEGSGALPLRNGRAFPASLCFIPALFKGEPRQGSSRILLEARTWNKAPWPSRCGDMRK